MMTIQEKLKQLSPRDFATLGINDVAFVKAVEVDGKPAFEIHAADGTPMAVVEQHEVAFAAIIQHDMNPVSVH